MINVTSVNNPGMGTVYQATDRLSGSAVALKRVLLRHPNISPHLFHTPVMEEAGK